MLLFSAIRWMLFDFGIQLMEMETLRNIQTQEMLLIFTQSIIPFLLQNQFMKKVTFQIPVLSSAKSSQQSARVLPQRTYIARSILVSDSPSKRCLDSHLCLEKSISAAKPSLQDFLLTALSSFCCMLTLGISCSLAELFPLTL